MDQLIPFILSTIALVTAMYVFTSFQLQHKKEVKRWDQIIREMDKDLQELRKLNGYSNS
jgi:hypothetical protein